MKNLSCILLLTVGIIYPAFAEDNFSMDVASMREEALKRAHEKMQDGFSLLDIDGNGKLSRRECSGSGSVDALKSFPFFSQSELNELAKKVDDAFDLYDKDKDNYLSKEEAEGYITYVENLGLDLQINKMDKNGDGKITDDEMMGFMQSMPSLEESVAKLQQATEKLKEINKNPEQHLNQMLLNVGSAISNEEFAQMDTDQNGQATAQEYAEYMFNHPNNKELDFSKQDYLDIFQEMDPSKKGYITSQEYTEYNQKQFNDVMSEIKQQAEEN